MKATFKCPKCGKMEKLEIPKNKCIPFHKCINCKELIFAKKGDCCIFCSYSDKKCPVSTKK